MSQDYVPEPGMRIVRHDAGCEAYLPSGSCDCCNARYVDEEGREISVGKRDAGDLLVQVEGAATWLVRCPRDGALLALLPDSTEKCRECGWHTGDDLLPPEARDRLARMQRHRHALLVAAVGFPLDLLAVILASHIVRLRWYVIVWCALLGSALTFLGRAGERRSQEEEPSPTERTLPPSRGGVVGRGKAPRRPPLGSSAYIKEQIIASYSVPPHRLGPSDFTPARRVMLCASITAATTTIVLSQMVNGWRRGALILVAIDPGMAQEEHVLAVLDGANTLRVKCRGFEPTTAACHLAGAEVQFLAYMGSGVDTKVRRMRPMP